MRRIGIFFFALFAITVVLAGCGEKEPKTMPMRFPHRGF